MQWFGGHRERKPDNKAESQAPIEGHVGRNLLLSAYPIAHFRAKLSFSPVLLELCMHLPLDARPLAR